MQNSCCAVVSVVSTGEEGLGGLKIKERLVDHAEPVKTLAWVGKLWYFTAMGISRGKCTIIYTRATGPDGKP